MTYLAMDRYGTSRWVTMETLKAKPLTNTFADPYSDLKRSLKYPLTLHGMNMPNFNRRSAMTTALVAGASISAIGGAAKAQDQTTTLDEELVIGAGLNEEEADCWKKTADAASAFFKLPALHSMDKQEVASAIHIIQNKLLSRPTYRKYRELAEASQVDKD